MNIWGIQDKIKRGFISYNLGDEVICFVRKNNGHPKAIKDGVVYVIKHIDLDGHLMVAQLSSNGIGFLQPVRVHKTYMINKSELRNIKLNYLFDETK
jgi:hypothetical protein